MTPATWRTKVVDFQTTRIEISSKKRKPIINMTMVASSLSKQIVVLTHLPNYLMLNRNNVNDIDTSIMVILFYSIIAVGIFIGSTQSIYSTKAYQQLDAITAEHST
mmetsp:Transcript_13986/g.35180  ORF Transcript_13986/g.35180 Transcript_13986/m.35180 type:complete len:106 (-) Transcript_13986:487-804(-)